MTTLAFLAGEQGLFVLLVILLLLGGKKLPELARGLGEAMREFKKAQRDDTEITESSGNKPLPPA
jgi:sec-independent protein translocase protein TatA